MIETKDRTIGTTTFFVTQLGFKKCRAVFSRLAKILGPALGHLLEGGGVEAKVAGALEALCSQVSEADLEYLCDTFAETTLVKMSDGKKAPLNADMQETLFGGQIEICFKWLSFALEVNYAGFFGELKGAIGSRPEATPPA